MLFNGENIFGVAQRQQGPFTSFRTMQRRIPGISGIRMYRLGDEVLQFVVTGILTGNSLLNLRANYNAAQSYIDGLLYTFIDTAGIAYNNCTLNDYRQTGPIQRVDAADGVTHIVQISATIIQCAPGT